MRDRLWIAAALLTTTAAAWGEAAGTQNAQQGPLIVLALLPAGVCCFTALEVVLWVLAPAALSATCRAIVSGRGRCLLTGLGTAVIAFVLASILGRLHADAASAVILGVTALGGLMGVTAVTSLVGTGAIELAGRSGSRALTVVVGSVLLFLTSVIPIVGWVLGVYFLLIGLGGVLQALAPSK